MTPRWTRVRRRVGRVLCWLLAFAIASLLVVWSYGHFAARARGPRGYALAVEPAATILDRVFAPLADDHPGQSGMSLHTSNVDAFAVRMLSTRAAERSLDLQYYLWHVDVTGRLLMKEVLAAADRGVRVRMILDDINAHGADAALRTLATHPHIDVRMFNPSRNRGSDLRRGLELLLRATSLNRRMHNKAWIADGRIAVVGGRNIGDEYFDAAITGANFVDTDLSLFGPVVADVSAIFDSFWNSDVVLPVGALADEADFTLADVRLRLGEFASGAEARPYLEHVAAVRSIDRILTGRHIWSDEVEVYSDPPDKRQREGGWLIEHVLRYFAKAQQSVDLVSPYFVPGDAGVARVATLRQRNVGVAILTNSLAATDVSAVHGGYAKYRAPRLSLGVDVFELMPVGGAATQGGFGSSGASLHTKVFTVDDEWGFVGSLNFDPRSVSLNTEMGCFFRSPDINAKLRAAFTKQTSAAKSYRVFLRGDELRWEDREASRIFTDEPQTGWWDRTLATVTGWLPIESQL